MCCDWLVVSQILPANPAGGLPGAEVRRYQGGGDAGLLAGRGEKAHRAHRHGPLAELRDRGAAPGDALQLRAGERGPGNAAAGLLRAGEPGLVEAPREGRGSGGTMPSSPPGGRRWPSMPISRRVGLRSRRRRSFRSVHPSGRTADGPGDEALRPNGGHGDGRRDGTHRDLNEDGGRSHPGIVRRSRVLERARFSTGWGQ